MAEDAQQNAPQDAAQQDASLDMEEVCFQIIANVGSAKSQYIEAISKAQAGDFDGARAMIESGSKDFLNGHNVHLQLLTNDAGGRSVKFSMLLMHAEDQLMEAETFRVVAENFISVYERMGKLELSPTGAGPTPRGAARYTQRAPPRLRGVCAALLTPRTAAPRA